MNRCNSIHHHDPLLTPDVIPMSDLNPAAMGIYSYAMWNVVMTLSTFINVQVGVATTTTGMLKYSRDSIQLLERSIQTKNAIGT